jgi:hypothetical protein
MIHAENNKRQENFNFRNQKRYSRTCILSRKNHHRKPPQGTVSGTHTHMAYRHCNKLTFCIIILRKNSPITNVCRSKLKPSILILPSRIWSVETTGIFRFSGWNLYVFLPSHNRHCISKMRYLKRHAACDSYNAVYRDMQTHTLEKLHYSLCRLRVQNIIFHFAAKTKGFRKNVLRSLHKLQLNFIT